MTSPTVLAFDFGASSGRAIRAYLREDGHLHSEEIHRFENNPIEQDGALRWDFNTLMANIHEGIAKAGKVDSIGIDTWGVDFGLLGENGALLENPVHYRDTRTEGIQDLVFKRITPEALYAQTGNQIMNINSLFQLVALQEHHPATWAKVRKVLFMPDLFSYHLCGEMVCEMTIASTSQLFNPQTRTWDRPIFDLFGFSPDHFGRVIPAGTVIGEHHGAKVIAVAGHDTQCASAAIPATQENIAFLSCGTWSLLGMDLDEPILTPESLHKGLSNEISANGKINYLKNIIGLWLIQESRREWRRQGQEYSYSELEKLAQEAAPLRTLIDPDAPEFVTPGDIPARIRTYAERTGQPMPETVGEITRCIYESLALKYRMAIDQLEQMTGKPVETLHLLGGGSQSASLCQFTANSCARPVIAGPVEATALGNIMVQLTALGALPDQEAGRRMIASAEPLHQYQPQRQQDWAAAYERIRRIVL